VHGAVGARGDSCRCIRRSVAAAQYTAIDERPWSTLQPAPSGVSILNRRYREGCILEPAKKGCESTALGKRAKYQSQQLWTLGPGRRHRQ
jgi:hypothetical protein